MLHGGGGETFHVVGFRLRKQLETEDCYLTLVLFYPSRDLLIVRCLMDL